MDNNILPVGTIVELNNSDALYMIVGFLPVNNRNNQLFQYSAVTYPGRSFGISKLCMFNHNDIKKVIFEGFSDDDFEKYKKDIEPYVERTKNEQTNN